MHPHRRCHCHHRPPPFLFLPVFLLDVLIKALAPLHRRGIAEPKLLLRSICFVHACAAHKGCLLLAIAVEAPSLSMMFPPTFLLEAKCPLQCRRLDRGNGSGCLIHNGSLHRANTLLILDEFVSKSAKEFEADRCSVVGADHLMEK